MDFHFVLDCVAELRGEDLLKYLRLNRDNRELRSGFVLTLENC